jgi:hypothetical protein
MGIVCARDSTNQSDDTRGPGCNIQVVSDGYIILGQVFFTCPLSSPLPIHNAGK